MNFIYCAFLQRKNDSFFMDNIHSTVSSNSDLKKLIVCRLYLNILLLSDIININSIV